MEIEPNLHKIRSISPGFNGFFNAFPIRLFEICSSDQPIFGKWELRMICFSRNRTLKCSMILSVGMYVSFAFSAKSIDSLLNKWFVSLTNFSDWDEEKKIFFDVL